eukprot:Opistho-2@66919
MPGHTCCRRPARFPTRRWRRSTRAFCSVYHKCRSCPMRTAWRLHTICSSRTARRRHAMLQAPFWLQAMSCVQCRGTILPHTLNSTTLDRISRVPPQLPKGIPRQPSVGGAICLQMSSGTWPRCGRRRRRCLRWRHPGRRARRMVRLRLRQVLPSARFRLRFPGGRCLSRVGDWRAARERRGSMQWTQNFSFRRIHLCSKTRVDFCMCVPTESLLLSPLPMRAKSLSKCRLNLRRATRFSRCASRTCAAPPPSTRAVSLCRYRRRQAHYVSRQRQRSAPFPALTSRFIPRGTAVQSTSTRMDTRTCAGALTMCRYQPTTSIRRANSHFSLRRRNSAVLSASVHLPSANCHKGTADSGQMIFLVDMAIRSWRPPTVPQTFSSVIDTIQ